MVWDKNIFYIIVLFNLPIIIMFFVFWRNNINSKIIKINLEENENLDEGKIIKLNNKKVIAKESLKLILIPLLLIFFDYYICIKMLEIL
ncbi:hypothetical protein [Clostridium senegalense]|uniref:hypothetical protein n=1 Tax=Clostridium senegalense TaxID=1465809 RepID=UPI000287B978|nr:hypothetical protein [Clostridium senegalense]